MPSFLYRDTRARVFHKHTDVLFVIEICPETNESSIDKLGCIHGKIKNDLLQPEFVGHQHQLLVAVDENLHLGPTKKHNRPNRVKDIPKDIGRFLIDFHLFT